MRQDRSAIRTKGWGRSPGAALLLLLLPLTILAASAAELSPAASADLARADRLYAERSYALALPVYEEWEKAGGLPPERRDDVGLRVAVCLGKTQKWDRARDVTLVYLKAHQGTLWEARALVWLAVLYEKFPDTGYRLGDRLLRERESARQGYGGSVTSVALGDQHARNGLHALEAARVLYQSYRETAGLEEEEIQLNYALISALTGSNQLSRWLRKQDWAPPEDPTWQVDPTEPYSPAWPPPRKHRYLFEQISRLTERLEPGSRRTDLNRVAEAVWFHTYHQQMRWAARKRDEQGRPVGKELIPYPYQERSAVALLQEVIARKPDDSLGDQTSLRLAEWKRENGKPGEVVADLRRFLQRRADSRWAPNAQKMLRDLTTPILAVYSDTFEPDRRPPTLRVACRSVPEIRLRLYRARLLEAYRDLDPATADYSLPSPFQQKEGPEPWYGEKLAEWEFRPHYRGEFQYQSTNVSLPISRPGTYVVEASGGGLKLRTLVTANTLQFVAVPNGDRVEFFAGDSRTGRALSGVELVVAESWNHSRERAGQAGRRGRVRRVHTNGDGLAAVPWTPLPQHDSHRMWVLAHRSEQYAICTGLEYHAPQPPPSEGEAEIRSYSVTDRFVYRPGQEVHLRHLLFQRERTGWQPAAGKTVHAEIYGPRGGVRLKYQGKTSEFGSFHGSVRLPPEAPLGHYSVSLRDSEDRQTFGSSGFQVEEYRKPEFGVTIEVGAERVRPGQNVAAMVKVRYYSGGAVPQAQVRYRVRRNSWSYVPSPLRPFETRFPTVDFRRQHPGPDIVVEGAAHTDDQGELQIPFSTQPPEDAASRGDYHYTIEADVQGASRQVISGRTDLLVTQRNLFVSLYGDQGYWQLGERVRLELAARNALSRPVSVTGIARVYRRPEFLVQARRVVHTARVTVDQEGRGSLAWTPAESGRYDVEFHAQDGDGQPVVSKHSLWVDGPPPDSNRRRRYQLELHVKSPYYRVGETARVLVVGMAESTVLVYRTVNHRRLESHVVRLPDGRAEVEFPVTDQDAPNTEIHAVALWAGRPEARVELLVPPLERLATVTVRADRARYQPGERARLAVAVRDWQGRPLRTELSVAVADAALDYIATSSAENIQHRLFGERRGFWFRTAFSSELQHFTYEWQRLENPSTPAPIPLFAFLESEFPTRGVWGYASGCGGAAGPGAVVSRGSYGSSLQQAAMARAGPAGVIHPSLGSGAETRTVDPHLVRTRFVDTAYWTPAVVTGADGKATIEFTWPDNLTRWRAVGIGTTREAQLGAGETTMETGKDLQVRLQVPRFTVERDRIALTSVVQNNTDRPRRAAVRLDLQGDAAEPVTGEPLEREVRLPARGETRVDWRLHARREGSLTVRTAAQSETLQDGMELTFPVLVHGAERIGTQSGVVRAEGETELKIELPSARKPGNSEVVVQLSPSMATVMLDALPYLVEYPYGCIEQTVSRFVPAVVTARTLKDLGYDLEALGARAEQLRRRPPADPSREYGASPYSFPAGPLGRTPRADRRRDLQLLPSGLASPIYSSTELDLRVQLGLDKIAEQQRPDGGWGWWPGSQSDPYMTAWVLYGLATARQTSSTRPNGILPAGRQFLMQWLPKDPDLNRVAFLVRVLATLPSFDVSRVMRDGGQRAFDQRERLSAYSQALLAIGFHHARRRAEAELLLRNLENTVRVDRENGQAF